MEAVDAYRIDSNKIIEIRNGNFMCLSKAKLELKETGKTEWEITALSSILDYITSRGFENIITLKKDEQRKPFFKNNERLYIMYDHYEGSKLKLNCLENGIKILKMTAEFHNASEGYVQPSGIKIGVFWGKKMEEYRGLTLRLEKYYKCIRCEEPKNQLDAYIYNYGEEILKRAKASMKVLKSVAYLKALESSMRKKEVCLNKISNKTSVVYDGDIFITKAFDMGYNMVEEDIAMVVKKVIEDAVESIVCNDLTDSYESIRELDDNSNLIIKALAAFPEDSIKTIDKYIKESNMDEVLLAKLKKYWMRESKVNLLEV